MFALALLSGHNGHESHDISDVLLTAELCISIFQKHDELHIKCDVHMIIQGIFLPSYFAAPGGNPHRRGPLDGAGFYHRWHCRARDEAVGGVRRGQGVLPRRREAGRKSEATPLPIRPLSPSNSSFQQMQDMQHLI